jgi:hypothetical protein
LPFHSAARAYAVITIRRAGNSRRCIYTPIRRARIRRGVQEGNIRPILNTRHPILTPIPTPRTARRTHPPTLSSHHGILGKLDDGGDRAAHARQVPLAGGAAELLAADHDRGVGDDPGHQRQLPDGAAAAAGGHPMVGLPLPSPAADATRAGPARCGCGRRGRACACA